MHKPEPQVYLHLAYFPAAATFEPGWVPTGTCGTPGCTENNELIKDKEDVQDHSTHGRKDPLMTPMHDCEKGGESQEAPYFSARQGQEPRALVDLNLSPALLSPVIGHPFRASVSSG